MAKNDEIKRADHDRNLTAIRAAIYAHIVETKGKAPTYSDLAEKTGLSYKTIERRYKEIEFKAIDSYFRLLTPDIIVAIAEAAKKGSSASQKLWMQVVEGWSETHQIKQIQEQPLFPYINENGISSNNGNKQITEADKP